MSEAEIRRDAARRLSAWLTRKPNDPESVGKRALILAHIFAMAGDFTLSNAELMRKLNLKKSRVSAAKIDAETFLYELSTEFSDKKG